MSGVKEEIQKVLSCKQYASGPRHLFPKGQSSPSRRGMDRLRIRRYRAHTPRRV
jgi:hypothetical protein